MDWSVMLVLASKRDILVTHVASYLGEGRKNKQKPCHLITEELIMTLQFMYEIFSQHDLEQSHRNNEAMKLDKLTSADALRLSKIRPQLHQTSSAETP